MTALPSLAPCPFCQSTSLTERRDINGWPTVQCDDCGAIGPCISSTNAIAAWNRRTAPSQEDVARVIDPEAWGWLDAHTGWTGEDVARPGWDPRRIDASLERAAAIIARMGQTGDGWRGIASAPKQWWPAGCRDPSSCERNRRCGYHGCRWQDVDIAKQIDDAVAALPAPPAKEGR